MKLRLRVEREDGEIRLYYGAAQVRAVGVDVGALTPGTEIEAECAYGEGGLRALAMGGEQPLGDRLAALVDEGRAGEALNQLARAVRTGVPLSSELEHVRVRALLATSQRAQAKSRYQAMLKLIERTSSVPTGALETTALFEEPDRSELGRELVVHMARLRDALPPSARLPRAVPLALWPEELLFAAAKDALGPLADAATQTEGWTHEAEFRAWIAEAKSRGGDAWSRAEALEAEAELALVAHRERARWNAIGAWDRGSLDVVEQLFRAPIDPRLRAAWQEALDAGAASAARHKTDWTGTAQFVDIIERGAGDLLSDAFAIQQTLARPHAIGDPLTILPFARIGELGDDKRTAFALDLESPERPVVRWTWNVADDVDEPSRVERIAPDIGTWLDSPSLRTAAKLLDATRARAPLPAPEKVTTEEAQLLERIRGEVGKRGLVLGEPIPARALERFEKAHGVRLPAGFRTFLLRIGNGGSGPPAKGLRALEETPHLDLDFPFTESRDWVDVEEQVVLEGLHRNASHGRLRLGGNAEGEEMILIVSGPERGKVWLHGEDGVAPYEAPNDFLSWYSGWLFS